ncbi:VWA-like domain-containing protein [Pseudorhodobacter sp. MZDSW-24AT]|uniref:vWA domain-containing protein n=1 Tax=Pseudorhodobacter sp. MZDSW-24AT TaxID=2052957 RepID=UPI0012FD9A59|nr:VWA-like domain-containing protein [Pseudorhodobacter sp. MZDSW-24AT]
MTAPGQHSARARPALVHLAAEDPALGALALWCAHRDAEGGPPARTTGITIHYGPGFADLPAHEQVGLAAHHILHVALRHGPRMGAMAQRLGQGFDPALYTIAADALLNETLLAAHYALPRPALTLTDLLTQALGLPPGPDALTTWDVDRLYLQLAAPADGKRKGKGPKGQGGDSPTPSEAAHAMAARAGFAPDLSPATPDADSPEGADQAAQWRQHLTRAMEAGRLAGRGIGLIGHRLADLAPPRTPWEHVLRRLLTRALLPGRSQTHRRPARDWIAAEALARSTGAPTPGFRPATRRTTDVPRIALAIDASGSVDGALLHRFLSETTGIARRVAAEIHLIAFDDALRWQIRLDPARWQTQIAGADWPRGGGTDFAPPLAAAQALHASVAVVLTDLEGPFGPPPRGLPVIWGLTTPAPAPPFGQILPLTH